jgi:hypothetical protein
MPRVGKRWDIKPLTFKSGVCPSSKAPLLVDESFKPLSRLIPLNYAGKAVEDRNSKGGKRCELSGPGWEHSRWSGYLRQRLGLLQSPEEFGFCGTSDIVKTRQL